MAGKLQSFIRRKIFRIDKDRWDHQYAKGQWDSLRTEEMERLIVANNLLAKYVSGGNILEIGCGEGIFFNNLRGISYDFYEGLDLSEVAISRIKRTPDSLFVSGDMETYVPVHHPFSAIVLNEVLYYSKNATGLLKRYSDYLSSDGIFLIGMHDTEKSQAVWNSIKEIVSELDTLKVEQEPKAWYYKTCKPKG